MATAVPPFDAEKANVVSWLNWFRRHFWNSQGRGGSTPRKRFNPDSTQDFVEPPAGSLSSSSSSIITAGHLNLRFGVVSVTGNVREHNEDSYYVPPEPATAPGSLISAGTMGAKNDSFDSAPTSEADKLVGSPSSLFIVADGMGGQLAGEKASQMAVELIPREVAKRVSADHDSKTIQRVLRESVARANDEILALSHVGTEYANMGTTVVIAHFQGDHAYVAGIGDSRVYRLRGDRFDQLTRDHSLANALGEAGTIRPEEVENHKFKHVLYLYLGSKDARDGPEEIRVVDVRPGDQFLLATDGLMGVVRDDMIVDIMKSHRDPQLAAQVLVDRALELRSKDNITALVIHLS